MTTVKARNGQLRHRGGRAIVARQQLMFRRGDVDGEKNSSPKPTTVPATFSHCSSVYVSHRLQLRDICRLHTSLSCALARKKAHGYVHT